MKVCPKCKQNRRASSFHKNKTKSNGLHSYCKKCNAARQRTYNKKNNVARSELQRVYILRKVYGITPEIYQEILDKQNGCCAICQKHHTSFSKRLAVEHCHKTGRIRGLCCTYCNRGLAAYHDKPDYFRRAADYLEQQTGYSVPEDYKKPKRYRTKKI